MENKIILITGANSGLGKDAARQLAMRNETERIYLACRNQAKAEAAKAELESKTGRKIFEIVLTDVSDPDSVRQGLKNLNEPIDALIMNAGGMGGKTPEKLTKDGVTQQFAANILGHVVLLNELVLSDRLNHVALYAGSEAARGIKKMKIERPDIRDASVEELKSMIDGSFFKPKFDGMVSYAHVKLMAALWMSYMARKNPDLKFVTVSPGGTSGTNVMEDMPAPMKLMFKYFMMPIMMPLMGLVHKLDQGAKRYLDGISYDSFRSGAFYASKEETIIGPLVDQSAFFADLTDEDLQDRVAEAISQVIRQDALVEAG